MSKVTQIQERLIKARELVSKLEAEFEALRLKELQKVEMTKVGNTITLKFGDRVLKVKKNPRYNRFDVFENGQKIIIEYMHGIHDLRFAISQGNI